MLDVPVFAVEEDSAVVVCAMAPPAARTSDSAVAVVNREFGNGVKRAAWLRTNYARNVVQSVHQYIATGYIFFHYIPEVRMRRLQGCHRCDLPQGGRTQAGLGKFQGCAHDIFVVRNQRSDANTTHRIAFRN